jgi:hypothetical protein
MHDMTDMDASIVSYPVLIRTVLYHGSLGPEISD